MINSDRMLDVSQCSAQPIRYLQLACGCAPAKMSFMCSRWGLRPQHCMRRLVRQRLLMTQRVRQVQRAVVMERQLQQARVPAESAEVGEQISIVTGCLQRETAQ